MLYINIWLLHLCFSLRKDIFNHKNICCFSFFNNSNLFFIISVYYDNCQSALKYLKDSEVNIWNMIIMAGNFNIKDSDWNPLYSFYFVHSDLLLEFADLFDLKLLHSIHQTPIWYSNNANDLNSVIDLFFL